MTFVCRLGCLLCVCSVVGRFCGRSMVVVVVGNHPESGVTLFLGAQM
jgi:hypothetical protein